MLKKSGLAEKVKGKKVAIKMHVGDDVSYSTIPPIFVRKLVSFIKDNGGECFVTDHYIAPPPPGGPRLHRQPSWAARCWTSAVTSASTSIRRT